MKGSVIRENVWFDFADSLHSPVMSNIISDVLRSYSSDKIRYDMI